MTEKEFIASLVDTEEMGELAYWSEEYLHAYEQLSDITNICNKLEQLQAELDKRKKWHDFFAWEREYKQLQAELEKLKEFARKVIEAECWDLIPLDGFDIQELAEKLSLIVPIEITKENADDNEDFEVGDIIFKFSSILKEGE